MPLTINKVDTNGYWMVGDTHIYVPSNNIKIEHSNVVGSSSGRSEDGVMRIDWVRRDVRKVNLKYRVMSASELNTLLGLMQGKEFVFKFMDRGSVKTINAYAGECSYEFYTYSIGGEAIYRDVEIHVIEK